MIPVVLASENPRGAEKWLALIQQHFPDLQAHIFSPDAGGPRTDVRAAIVWRPPAALFERYPALDLVFNMGAGVDAILRQPGMRESVRIIRLEDAGLANTMIEYVVYYVSSITRGFAAYEQHKAERRWQPEIHEPVQAWPVGVMGTGVIGARIANTLSQLGYRVSGWSRSGKPIDGVTGYAGQEQLGAFLAASRILINVLPLTDATRNILDRQLLSQLPAGAVLINIGRGEHLVEEALIPLLDSGQLSRAVLDVTRTEPLPADHPFWMHPAITLTPHISGPTNHLLALAQIRAKLNDAMQGKPITGEVTRSNGY